MDGLISILRQLWELCHLNIFVKDFSNGLVFLDVLLVFFLIYQGLLLLKGTKAVRMLLGLMLLVVFYSFGRSFRLHTLTWILQQFFSSFILVVVILFQDDLRRGLSRVGIDPFSKRLGGLSAEEQAGLGELVRAVGILSTKKIGALIIWKREADLSDHIQEGTPLDALISEELLFSVFLPYSPLHDGAVVLHLGRIVRASCFLPLTQNPSISKHLGTRHRAAIGLSEATDALVVVVSETDGKISLCRDGVIVRSLDPASLYNEMLSILEPRSLSSEQLQALEERNNLKSKAQKTKLTRSGFYKRYEVGGEGRRKKTSNIRKEQADVVDKNNVDEDGKGNLS